MRRAQDWKAIAAIVFYIAVIAMIAFIIINQLRGGSNGDDLPNTGITREEIYMEKINLNPMGFDEWLEAVCGIYDVDPALVRAIIDKESGWQPDAVNPTSGAMGLMQIMPGTWEAQVADMRLCFGTTPEECPLDPLDPYDNVRVGLWLLSRLLRKYPYAMPYALDCYALGEGGAMERLMRLPDYEPTAWAQEILKAAHEKIDEQVTGESYIAVSPESK